MFPRVYYGLYWKNATHFSYLYQFSAVGREVRGFCEKTCAYFSTFPYLVIPVKYTFTLYSVFLKYDTSKKLKFSPGCLDNIWNANNVPQSWHLKNVILGLCIPIMGINKPNLTFVRCCVLGTYMYYFKYYQDKQG